MTTITEESFLHDVRNHQMTVLRDDGLYRHVRFSRPNTRNMQFDLVTWPGYLAYCGDMGDYTFSRLADMFEFFRKDPRYPDGLYINKQYWGEKLLAIDKCDGFKKFSDEKFNRAVMEYLVSWIRDHRHDTTPEQRRTLWNEVLDEVIHIDDGDCGYRKRAAAHDFRHSFGRYSDMPFEFIDFWETSVEEYSGRFLWCCYAIAWGIAQYDKSKETT